MARCSSCQVLALLVVANPYAWEVILFPEMARMRASPMSAQAHVEGCQALMWHSKPAKSLAYLSGFQYEVVAAMWRLMDEPRVQVECSMMLASWVQWDPIAAVAVGRAGVIDVQVAAIRRHPEQPDVRKLLSHIGSFCDFIEKHREQVSAAGGIDLSFELAYDRFYNDSALQTYVQCFYSTQCWHEEALSKMRKNGYIRRSVQSMRDYPKQEGLRGEVVFVVDVCPFQTDEDFAAMEASGLIEEVVKAFRDAPHMKLDVLDTPMRVYESGMRLIVKLIEHNASNCDAAISAGAVKEIASILTTTAKLTERQPFMVNVDVLASACRALLALSGCGMQDIARLREGRALSVVELQGEGRPHCTKLINIVKEN